ncbi:MAG: hypothetical protein D6724_10700 [Armatimonadetes bacterium]|nr:MAG: hypothetical protein D6724_10700 [Armatimonadota bacterium]
MDRHDSAQGLAAAFHALRVGMEPDDTIFIHRSPDGRFVVYDQDARDVTADDPAAALLAYVDRFLSAQEEGGDA